MVTTMKEIKAPLLGSARLRHPVAVVTRGLTDLHDWMNSLAQVSGCLMTNAGWLVVGGWPAIAHP